MAGTNYNATNVALLALGASGDNLIGDGYVRAVEKIWLDSYVWTASAGLLGTSDTVCIGVIPANKKIVGLEIMVPSTFAPTNTTIYAGVSIVTGSATFISASTAYAINAPTAGVVTFGKVTMNVSSGLGYVTTQSTLAVSGGAAVVLANTNIYMSVGVTAMTAPTAGTITTIIRYT